MLLNNIYVINLDRSKSRLEAITKNLTTNGIKFNRFSGIDGSKLESKIINEKTNIIGRTFLMNSSVVGCAQSHIELWKQLVLDNSTGHYVILEDDARIDKNFGEIMLSIEKSIPKVEFDILSLHCLFGSNCFHYKTIYRLTDTYVIGKPFFPLTTTAYIISKEGACKLLKMMEKITYHIDFEIAVRNLFQNINYLSLNKNIVESDFGMNSTIGSTDRKSIVMIATKKMGLNNLYWLLNVPTLTIGFKYSINMYFIILLILLIINFLTLKNIYIYIIILVEMVLNFV